MSLDSISSMLTSSVNMLYIDEPNQVGLSYDILANGTQDLTDGSGNVAILDFSNAMPKQNDTFLVGTFPSQLLNSSANGTTNAARALWHFAQVWFQTFPDYKVNFKHRYTIITLNNSSLAQ